MSGRESIDRKVSASPPERSLYRPAAMTAFSRRGDGVVLVVAPPCARVAVWLALLVLTLVGAALWVVEIPRRAPAVGVLMPPGGMVAVRAPVAARVTRLAARSGDDVREGDVLMTLSSERNDANGAPLVGETLASLARELELATDLYEKRLELNRARGRDLGRQRQAAARRAAIAAEELAVAEARVAIRHRGLERARALERRGLLAPATVEEREHAWLAARTLAAAGKRARNEAARARDELAERAARLDEESRIATLEHARESERLEREIRAVSLRAAQRITAPRSSRVAHVAVSAGSTVNVGQLLMTLYEPGRELEAWLYVSTANVGRLRPGLEVRLKLDAWPHQRFGAPSATITSISAGALAPGELSGVPLALDAPVFEVRARLQRRTVGGFEHDAALKPGTSFRADLIRTRYRLYEWLGRSLKDAAGDGTA